MTFIFQHNFFQTLKNNFFKKNTIQTVNLSKLKTPNNLNFKKPYKLNKNHNKLCYKIKIINKNSNKQLIILYQKYKIM